MNKCRRERILMNANQKEVAVFSVWGIIWIIHDMNYMKRKKSNCTLLGGGWWQEQRDGARKQAAAGLFQ